MDWHKSRCDRNLSVSSTIVECLSNTIDSFIGSQFCIIQGLKCGSALDFLVAEFLELRYELLRLTSVMLSATFSCLTALL